MTLRAYHLWEIASERFNYARFDNKFHCDPMGFLITKRKEDGSSNPKPNNPILSGNAVGQRLGSFLVFFNEGRSFDGSFGVVSVSHDSSLNNQRLC